MPARLCNLGIHLFVLFAITGAAVGAVLGFGRVPVPWKVPPYPRLPVRSAQGAADPISLAQEGLPAGARGTEALRPRPGIHTILVSPHRVTLLAGGRMIESVSVAPRSPGLAQLVRILGRPGWISEPRRGVVVLRAALIMQAGTSLVLAPPSLHLLVLADVPPASLIARGATILMNSVTVESPESAYHGGYRPFVLAESKSHLQITRSHLTGLGWNWNESYGVTWNTGSTGGATDSIFTGNYFGVYTASVSGLTFSRNVVAGNYSYGFDPHSYSSRLSIVGNTVIGNGRHGIILADHVTGSSVTHNIVQGNGANGVTAYKASSGNLIATNTITGNHGDGLVFTSSPGNRVIGNVIRGNRVGLHLKGTGPGTLRLAGNLVAGNALNVQGIRRVADNSIAVDGHRRWDGDVLLIVFVLGLVLTTVTVVSLTSCLLGNREAG